MLSAHVLEYAHLWMLCVLNALCLSCSLCSMPCSSCALSASLVLDARCPLLSLCSPCARSCTQLMLSPCPMLFVLDAYVVFILRSMLTVSTMFFVCFILILCALCSSCASAHVHRLKRQHRDAHYVIMSTSTLALCSMIFCAHLCSLISVCRAES